MIYMDEMIIVWLSTMKSSTAASNPKAQPMVDTDSLLPLKPDVFTVLLVLLEGDRHGYGMIKAAEARRGRKGQLQPGALYRVLRQMLDGGLIEQLAAGVTPAGEAKSGDERRRYYRITEFGREVAAAEAARMEELVMMSKQYDLLPHRKS